jgi:hypothetical protein
MVALVKQAIEVVRTSTAYPERRQFRRHSVDLGAELFVDSRPHARSRSAILAGAAPKCVAHPVVAIGTPATLRLDGFADLLPCSVWGSEANDPHLAFDLDMATAESPRMMLVRLKICQAA